jgi:signal transduction histidine kinase
MKAGRHLLLLINDLLDISSIEAGGAELEIAPVDLGELLQESPRAGCAGRFGSRVEFSLEGPEQPLIASADRRRVVQVMLNLVSNAAKYNRTGNMVRLSCRASGRSIRVEVEDDGPGVASAEVPRLFTPFDRLGQQNRSRIDGTGLGLALSKRLVESMGGKIGYEAPATARGSGSRCRPAGTSPGQRNQTMTGSLVAAQKSMPGVSSSSMTRKPTSCCCQRAGARGLWRHPHHHRSGDCA